MNRLKEAGKAPARSVVVAMSGGVDSAVTAFLLKEAGCDVVAVTMCLAVAAGEGNRAKCCGPGEIEDARRVCRVLGIPHYVMDFSGDLEEKVIRPFVAEYLRGRTPNPCVPCNRHIKFGTLLDRTLAMGFDFLATGHYCGLEESNGRMVMKVPRDTKKDQTYFLHDVPGAVLPRVLFPLAGLTKGEVRSIAEKAGLPVSGKRESQDICFVPRGNPGSFVAARCRGAGPGDMVDGEGRVLGTHRGISWYTVGQRARLGGRPGRPLYVLSIDGPGNRVVVGPKSGLSAGGLLADGVNLLSGDLPGRAEARIRYAHRGAPCRAQLEGGGLRVTFDTPQEAVTPGQSVVLYRDGVVLGGGIISEAFT